MANSKINLPDIICLDEYGGGYKEYIDALYSIFAKDFIHTGTTFRGERLSIKWAPTFQGRPSTFYHITSEGKDENDRTPDLRRCERVNWAKPAIEKCDEWDLRIWPQIRGTKKRLCIWVDLEDQPDYIIILEVRKDKKLLWTTFVLEYGNQKRKKLKEYEEWLENQKPPGDA